MTLPTAFAPSAPLADEDKCDNPPSPVTCDNPPSPVTLSSPVTLCPMFVDLAGEPVAVAGAGSVALRKVRMLLSYGAQVTIVAPDAVAELQQLAAAGRIIWHQRGWQPEDGDGAVLVIAATSDPQLNADIAHCCHARTQLVNVVDTHEAASAGSSVMIPAVVRRGPFQIAVSTGGASPLLARAVREELEERYPAYYEDYVLLLGEVRRLVKKRVAGSAQDRRGLYAALEDNKDLLARARASQLPTPEQAYAQIVEPLVQEPLVQEPLVQEPQVKRGAQ